MSVEDKATFSYRCGVRLVSYRNNLGLILLVLFCPCGCPLFRILRWPCLSPFEAKAYDEVCPESWVLGRVISCGVSMSPCVAFKKRMCFQAMDRCAMPHLPTEDRAQRRSRLPPKCA